MSKQIDHHSRAMLPIPDRLAAGKIEWFQIDTGDDDHDHFIDPEERYRIAMATQ